jgi:hypothetical protein
MEGLATPGCEGPPNSAIQVSVMEGKRMKFKRLADNDLPMAIFRK